MGRLLFVDALHAASDMAFKDKKKKCVA